MNTINRIFITLFLINIVSVSYSQSLKEIMQLCEMGKEEIPFFFKKHGYIGTKTIFPYEGFSCGSIYYDFTKNGVNKRTILFSAEKELRTEPNKCHGGSISYFFNDSNILESFFAFKKKNKDNTCPPKCVGCPPCNDCPFSLYDTFGITKCASFKVFYKEDNKNKIVSKDPKKQKAFSMISGTDEYLYKLEIYFR